MHAWIHSFAWSLLQRIGYKGYLTKAELQQQAQPYTETSFTVVSIACSIVLLKQDMVYQKHPEILESTITKNVTACRFYQSALGCHGGKAWKMVITNKAND